ncbi:MAG: tRNA uridine-5-carboxymethylaminomethyl(34) synthesis GTPase MnmE [Candidatus Neomarinimicrobiota bacterium]
MSERVGYRTDTIIALATPPGRGGVAVARISGPQALTLIQQLCSAPLTDHPRHAFLVELLTPHNKQLLDKALVTYFKAPASFTGEDVVEISTHGGYITPGRIIQAIIGLGARPAEPGEFSLRAFLNGKMDLAEAEALNQLVSSLSYRGQVAASNNLSGRLSQEIAAVRESLLNLLTLLEHELDFSEEEIDVTSHQEIAGVIDQALEQLHHLKATAPYGRIIRDGVRVILAGSPNSGKSSLFNALIGHERAIVTDLPGTTRDSLEAWIDINGFPVCLVDTAGLRDSADTIEQLSVQRSQKELAAADIVLLLDPDDPYTAEVEADISQKVVLHIKSKVDEPPPDSKENVIRTSVLRQDGLDELLQGLKEILHSYVPQSESAIVTSERQLSALETAIEHMESVKAQTDEGQSIDIISGEIRLAVNSMAEIIGETTSEEVIQRIFSEFCVGK